MRKYMHIADLLSQRVTFQPAYRLPENPSPSGHTASPATPVHDTHLHSQVEFIEL